MARLIDKLVGHRETLEPLFQAAANDRLASTLIFSGPSGVGKRLAALALAQALVCEKRDPHGCGECGSCLRIERHGGEHQSSESLLEVKPEGAQIKIDQARDVLQFLMLRSLGRSRVILIDQAHLLGPQAANALLKSLEEPPPGTHFILITGQAASVLPTIRSRSQMVRFKPLSDEEIKKILGKDADPWVVRSARGSVESARHLLDEREEFESIEEATGSYLSASLSTFPSKEITTLRDLLRERGSHGFISGLIQGVMRDALRIQGGAQPLDSRWPKLLNAIAAFPNERVQELAEKSLEFENDLARNVDRGLLLENFAFRLANNRN
ncbi:MAG TPA: AAA family ATPase [Bdellovibrionales bacterium]|nr:AAA family ATPase [Bdellovibrionales bacterium]